MTVWLITGTSSGFGHKIAVVALNRGHKVIATARNASKLSELKSLGATTISLQSSARTTSENAIDDLKGVMDPFKEFLGEKSRKQDGDPLKGAKLIVEALSGSDRAKGRRLPNRRLLIGRDCVRTVRGITDRDIRELEEWEDLSTMTDCDDLVA